MTSKSPNMTNVWRVSDVMSDPVIFDRDKDAYQTQPVVIRDVLIGLLCLVGCTGLTFVLWKLLPHGKWVAWLNLAGLFYYLITASRGAFAVWRSGHSPSDFSGSIDMIRAKSTSILFLLAYILLGLFTFFLAFYVE